MKIEVIISGCKKGKKDAQEALVRRFGPTLLAICNRYCNDKNLAYDALQETFISVFKYIDTFKGVGSFEGWVKRIAVRSSLRLVKKFNNLKLTESEENLEFHMDSRLPNAYSNLEVEQIKKYINILPQSLRLVFNLYVVEGFSHKEISELLGIGESTSRANLTKARVKLINVISENSDVIYKNKFLKIRI